MSWIDSHQVDKFLPFYQRKKMMKQQRPPPAVFEMTPCSGLLSPAERINVQIKFSPAEGVNWFFSPVQHWPGHSIKWILAELKTTSSFNFRMRNWIFCLVFFFLLLFLKMVYCRQLVISMAESSQQIHMTARGDGEEPQLEFCPSELQLGPCLPNSTQAEAEVTVKNPCSFPIEFYSLELDTQYIEEEKVALVSLIDTTHLWFYILFFELPYSTFSILVFTFTNCMFVSISSFS